MPTANWHKPHFWRVGAEKIRTFAEAVTYPEPKAIILRIAADYERLADALSERNGGEEPPPWAVW
jgi:hypothetical protein